MVFFYQIFDEELQRREQEEAKRLMEEEVERKVVLEKQTILAKVKFLVS